MTTFDGQTVRNERQDPTHYAMIPKMATLDLDPYELALYCNYRQTTGNDGECFKSNKTLAKETKMSVSKVKDARVSLEQKGYIRIEYIPDESGVINNPPIITVLDIWGINHKRFSKKASHKAAGVVARKQGGWLPENNPQLPENTKEEPFNKNHLEEQSLASNDATALPPLTDDELDAQFPLSTAMKKSKADILPEYVGKQPKTKPRKESTPDPLYEAVERHVFATEPDPNTPYDYSTRIGGFTLWLRGDIEKYNKRSLGGKISRAAEPRHVEMFVKWYITRPNTSASLPRDVAKLVEYWREWASSVKGKVANGQAAKQPAQPSEFGLLYGKGKPS